LFQQHGALLWISGAIGMGFIPGRINIKPLTSLPLLTCPHVGGAVAASLCFLERENKARLPALFQMGATQE
jgi:hypothetical protein